MNANHLIKFINIEPQCVISNLLIKKYLAQCLF